MKDRDKNRSSQQGSQTDALRQPSQHMDRGHQPGMHAGEQPGQLGQAATFKPGRDQQPQQAEKARQANQPRMHRHQQR